MGSRYGTGGRSTGQDFFYETNSKIDTCKINAVLLFMNNNSATFKFSIKQTLVFKKKKNPIALCRYFRRFLSDECVCSPLSGFINFFPSVKPFDYTLRFSFYLFSFPGN